MDLKNARTLITGGGTGIGLETARALVAAGGSVAICGRRADVLAAAAEEIGCVAITADVSREPDVVRLVAKAVAELGGLNVLINNAAFGYQAPLVELDSKRFEEVHATNVLGAMLVAREAARHMIANGGGTIVNVGSTAAAKGYPGGSAYASSKFALTGSVKGWYTVCFRPSRLPPLRALPPRTLPPGPASCPLC